MVNGPLLLAWSSLWAVTRLENVHGSQSKKMEKKKENNKMPGALQGMSDTDAE